MFVFLRWFLDADFTLWKYRSFDFFLAFSSIAIGLWMGSHLWFWVGVAGIGMAILNPALRLQKFLLGRMRRHAREKTSVNELAGDA